MKDLDPTRLKAIVFDVDGTLYRHRPLRRAMVVRLVKGALSRPGSALTTFRALTAYRRAQEALRGTEIDGPVAAAQLRIASEQSGLAEEVIARVVAQWMEREPLPLMEGLVEPALRQLLSVARGRGLRLGVVSDYPATAKLEAMRLSEFFEVVVTAQDAGINRFKPDPSGLIEAVRRLEATPDQALYVGDRRDVDAPAARAANIHCVIVDGATRRGRQGGRQASTRYPSVSEVPDFGALHDLLFRRPLKNRS